MLYSVAKFLLRIRYGVYGIRINGLLVNSREGVGDDPRDNLGRPKDWGIEPLNPRQLSHWLHEYINTHHRIITQGRSQRRGGTGGTCPLETHGRRKILTVPILLHLSASRFKSKCAPSPKKNSRSAPVIILCKNVESKFETVQWIVQ